VSCGASSTARSSDLIKSSLNVAPWDGPDHERTRTAAGPDLKVPGGVSNRPTRLHTKLGNRLLEPLLAADHPPAPLELRHALAVIDNTIDDAIDHAHLKVAA
jgi:hypothetical protein